MGLKERLSDLFTRRDAEPDPEARVQVAMVPLFEGPMLVARLRDARIDADGIEAFDVVTGSRTEMKITVRSSDVASARAIIDADG